MSDKRTPLCGLGGADTPHCPSHTARRCHHHSPRDEVLLQSKGTKDLCYLKSTVVWGLKSAGRKGRYTVFSIGSLICMKTKQTFSLHKSRGWFGARHILLPHSCDSTGEKVTCFASVAFCTRLGHNVTSVRRQTWWRGAVSLAAPGRRSSMGVREGHCGD